MSVVYKLEDGQIQEYRHVPVLQVSVDRLEELLYNDKQPTVYDQVSEVVREYFITSQVGMWIKEHCVGEPEIRRQEDPVRWQTVYVAWVMLRGQDYTMYCLMYPARDNVISADT